MGLRLEYQSLEEGLAILAWRKRERIQLLQTMAIVTASVNPEKANESFNRLMEEMFPEFALERDRSVEKALKIMDREKDRLYSVLPVGETLRKGFGRGTLGKQGGRKRRGR